jgi:DNA-binding response OmpR family regulator
MDQIKKILIVDDEHKLLEVVESYLIKEGYEVLTADDGLKALEIIKNEKIHLVILDLMLPKMSGEEVCRKIRSNSDMPIIMLTAKVEEDNKLEGLAIGADDYMTKPFSVRELMGRIRALLRRSYRNDVPIADSLIFNDGDLKIDILKHQVMKKGALISLTPNEFKVLNILLINPGQVFTRDRLVEKAFGYDYEGFDRTIDTHIKNIRQKLEDDPKNPDYILTVYGVGYKFGGK